jgi:transposase
MRIRISLRKGEREALLKRLHQAYKQGEVRLIRRIHALLYFFEGKTVAEIVELLGLSGQTIYNYLQAFILNRLDSLQGEHPN